MRTGFRPCGQRCVVAGGRLGRRRTRSRAPLADRAFFRGAEAQRNIRAAPGLGLAIIRNSIEQCGGSVFCANEKPRGFPVTMIFPCGQRGE